MIRRNRSPVLLAVIEHYGGLAKLAAALGVTFQAVSQWDEVPADRCIELHRATGIALSELRPDLYPADVLRQPQSFPEACWN